MARNAQIGPLGLKWSSWSRQLPPSHHFESDAFPLRANQHATAAPAPTQPVPHAAADRWRCLRGRRRFLFPARPAPWRTVRLAAEPFCRRRQRQTGQRGHAAVWNSGGEAARAAATLFPAEATLQWEVSAAATGPHCGRSSRRPGLAHERKAAIYCLHAAACRGGKLGEYGRVGCAGRRARPGNTAPRLRRDFPRLQARGMRCVAPCASLQARQGGWWDCWATRGRPLWAVCRRTFIDL